MLTLGRIYSSAEAIEDIKKDNLCFWLSASQSFSLHVSGVLYRDFLSLSLSPSFSQSSLHWFMTTLTNMLSSQSAEKALGPVDSLLPEFTEEEPPICVSAMVAAR